MDKKLSILLIEDDPAACAEFISLIQSNERFSLVEVTNNATRAVEYVRDCLPDVVILDLELHLGVGNGILFLRDIRQLSLPKTPYILVTTNNSSQTTYDYIRQLGVDFIMSKHQQDYSSAAAVEFLNMMKDIILEKSNRQAPQAELLITPEQKEKNLARRICAELDVIGISPKAVGYQYLVDAIQIALRDGKGSVCNKVGQKYGKTTASVERAMQNAINRTWRSSDTADLLQHYTAPIHSEKGVPTITEFIFYYAQKLKLEY